MKLLFFRKDHCAPCTFAKPAVETFARTIGAEVHYFDCGQNRTAEVDKLLELHGIRSVPVVVAIDKDGSIKLKLSGNITVAALEAALL
jgi:glutaredoxin